MWHDPAAALLVAYASADLEAARHYRRLLGLQAYPRWWCWQASSRRFSRALRRHLGC